MTCTQHPDPDRRRVLPDRHDGDCDGQDCAGCLPCPGRHCFVCGRSHVDDGEQTCPGCIARARANLTAIWTMHTELRGQAAAHAMDAEPHRGHVLGGDAMVMLTSEHPLTVRGDGADYQQPADPLPPLALLATWEDDWRDVLGHAAAGRATIAGAVGYLLEQLPVAAQQHLAFDEFVRETSACVHALEDVLHDGYRPESGAPCFTCGTPLVRQHHPKRGFLDAYDCPSCNETVAGEAYRYAAAAEAADNAVARSVQALATEHGISQATIRKWVERGKVRKHGTLHGRSMVDVEDVRRAVSHERVA